MIAVIRGFINDPSGSFLMKALDCLVALRNVACEEDEVQKFNEFLKSIKVDSSSKMQAFFKNWIVSKNITLIKTSENMNGVADEEADQVMILIYIVHF